MAVQRQAGAALLAEDLDTLTVIIDVGHCGALYTPARDHDGTLDAAQVNVALVETIRPPPSVTSPTAHPAHDLRRPPVRPRRNQPPTFRTA